jgi:hypothetical protein
MKKHAIERPGRGHPITVVDLDECELDDTYANPDGGTFINFRELAEFANEHLGDDRLEVTFALAVNEGGEELEGHDEVVDWEDEFGLEEGRCLAVRGVTVCASGATILLYRVR